MATTSERLPQLEDRVEVRHYHEFGVVRRVDLSGEPSFFVRLDSGLGGWYPAPELRIYGDASASEIAKKRETERNRKTARTLIGILKARGIDGIVFPSPYNEAVIPIEAVSRICRLLEGPPSYS